MLFIMQPYDRHPDKAAGFEIKRTCPFFAYDIVKCRETIPFQLFIIMKLPDKATSFHDEFGIVI